MSKNTKTASPVETTASPVGNIADYQRKEQTIRDLYSELKKLEDEQSTAQITARCCKKPIAKLRSQIAALTICPIDAFLEWEKQENASLFPKPEDKGGGE